MKTSETHCLLPMDEVSWESSSLPFRSIAGGDLNGAFAQSVSRPVFWGSRLCPSCLLITSVFHYIWLLPRTVLHYILDFYSVCYFFLNLLCSLFSQDRTLLPSLQDHISTSSLKDHLFTHQVALLLPTTTHRWATSESQNHWPAPSYDSWHLQKKKK